LFLETWIQVVYYVSFFLFNAGNPNTIMALAGNKADLVEARQVPAEVCYCAFYKFYVSTYISCTAEFVLVAAGSSFLKCTVILDVLHLTTAYLSKIWYVKIGKKCVDLAVDLLIQPC